MYKIGILSDTHGLLRPEVKEVLKTCDAILHGGDINRQAILDELAQYAPVYAVRGNNDKEWAEGLPATRRITLAGIRFFMIHNRKQLDEKIDDCRIVVFGHTHKYAQQERDGVLWLNPGSCGPRRFLAPVTMAVIEVEEDGAYSVKKIELTADSPSQPAGLPAAAADQRKLVEAVMKDTDRGRTVEAIAARHGISRELAELICRLYVTHPGVDADGIMNKMELGKK